MTITNNQNFNIQVKLLTQTIELKIIQLINREIKWTILDLKEKKNPNGAILF
jgi:hypothetical protein